MDDRHPTEQQIRELVSRLDDKLEPTVAEELLRELPGDTTTFDAFASPGLTVERILALHPVHAVPELWSCEDHAILDELLLRDQRPEVRSAIFNSGNLSAATSAAVLASGERLSVANQWMLVHLAGTHTNSQDGFIVGGVPLVALDKMAVQSALVHRSEFRVAFRDLLQRGDSAALMCTLEVISDTEAEGGVGSLSSTCLNMLTFTHLTPFGPDAAAALVAKGDWFALPPLPFTAAAVNYLREVKPLTAWVRELRTTALCYHPSSAIAQHQHLAQHCKDLSDENLTGLLFSDDEAVRETVLTHCRALRPSTIRSRQTGAMLAAGKLSGAAGWHLELTARDLDWSVPWPPIVALSAVTRTPKDLAEVCQAMALSAERDTNRINPARAVEMIEHIAGRIDETATTKLIEAFAASEVASTAELSALLSWAGTNDQEVLIRALTHSDDLIASWQNAELHATRPEPEVATALLDTVMHTMDRQPRRRDWIVGQCLLSGGLPFAPTVALQEVQDQLVRRELIRRVEAAQGHVTCMAVVLSAGVGYIHDWLEATKRSAIEVVALLDFARMHYPSLRLSRMTIRELIDVTDAAEVVLLELTRFGEVASVIVLDHAAGKPAVTQQVVAHSGWRTFKEWVGGYYKHLGVPSADEICAALEVVTAHNSEQHTAQFIVTAASELNAAGCGDLVHTHPGVPAAAVEHIASPYSPAQLPPEVVELLGGILSNNPPWRARWILTLMSTWQGSFNEFKQVLSVT
jgi:hypothetical protein